MIASATLLAGLAAASVGTSFVSGILGMAGGMILLGILVAVLPLPAAMALHGVTQFASNAWRAAMLRREIDWRIVGGYAGGALVALGIFTLLRVVLPKPAVLIAMGVAPFLGLALPERVKLNVERRGHSFACGLACAALSLTAGIAGPLLDIFFVRSKMGRHSVIATKASTQVLSHSMKILYYGVIVGGERGAALDGVLAATMVVTAFVGTSLSGRVVERMTDTSFRQWTRRVIMALGIVYLTTGVATLVRASESPQPAPVAQACNAAPDAGRPQFIVGYGSLMQDASRLGTSPHAGAAHPVEVRGYRRGWYEKPKGPGFGTTFLGIRADRAGHFNAVVYEVDAGELAATDRREAAYCRAPVAAAQMDALDTGYALPADAQAWIYVTDPHALSLPDAAHPIVQSYVDVFVSGCLEQEERYHLAGFARECVVTTTGWSGHWVNDRILPRRPFVHQPRARAIDALLAAEVRRYFAQMHIE